MWGRMTFTLRSSVKRTADNTDQNAKSADMRAAASRRSYLGIKRGLYLILVLCGLLINDRGKTPANVYRTLDTFELTQAARCIGSEDDKISMISVTNEYVLKWHSYP